MKKKQTKEPIEPFKELSEQEIKNIEKVIKQYSEEQWK